MTVSWDGPKAAPWLMALAGASGFIHTGSGLALLACYGFAWWGSLALIRSRRPRLVVVK